MLVGEAVVVGISTESEITADRVPKAARRVSGSESICRKIRILVSIEWRTESSGVTGE